jgi:hypothetical protein
MKRTLPLLLLLTVSACTTPADVSRPLDAGKGNDAKIKIADTKNGFAVDVRYSRYQFIPESSALLETCRSIVTARAFEDRMVEGLRKLNYATARKAMVAQAQQPGLLNAAKKQAVANVQSYFEIPLRIAGQPNVKVVAIFR